MNGSRTNDLEARAASLRKLTELNPDNPDYLRSYAEVLMQLGHSVHADFILERLAGLLSRQGKEDQAREIQTLRETVRKDDRSRRLIHALEQAAETASFLQRPKTVMLREGEYLLRQGEPSSDVYLLQEGELCAWCSFPGQNKPVLVGHIRARSVVGDIAYFMDGKRSADLLASSDCRLLKFPVKTFSRLLLADAGLQESWQRHAEIRLRMLKLCMNPMLAAVPENLRFYLAEHAISQHFATFAIIASEGKPIEWVDMVVSGLVRRIVEGHTGDSHIFTAIRPGELAGWEASMHGHSGFSSDTHLTSLIAMEDTELIRIPMEIFREVLDLHPPLRTTVSRNIHSYVSETLSSLRRIGRIE